MKHRSLLAVTGCAVGIALALPGGSAIGAPPPPPSGTLTLVRHAVSQILIHKGVLARRKAKPSVGDTFVVTATVADTTGAPVGSAVRVCQVVKKGLDQCSSTYTLNPGQLMLAETVARRRPAGAASEAAILGGTGGYAGARGSAMITPASATTATIEVQFVS